MGDSNMIINAKDFSKEEFLEYVKIFIREMDIPITDLIDAPVNEFTT